VLCLYIRKRKELVSCDKQGPAEKIRKTKTGRSVEIRNKLLQRAWVLQSPKELLRSGVLRPLLVRRFKPLDTLGNSSSAWSTPEAAAHAGHFLETDTIPPPKLVPVLAENT
jgi:hypothetical protein